MKGISLDISHGGGQVATLIISSTAKKGFQVHRRSTSIKACCGSSFPRLESNSFPGLAAAAPDMTEFFTGH